MTLVQHGAVSIIGYVGVRSLPDPGRVQGRRGVVNIEHCTGAAMHSNGRVEGLNNRVRLIVRRGFGFHIANAALALVMLTCGPINLELPHQKRPAHPHR